MTLFRRVALGALVMSYAFGSSLVAQAVQAENSTHAYVAPASPAREYGYIGVQLNVRPSDFALVIDHVIRGSKAQFSGLQDGDVLMKVENQDVHSNCELYHAIGSKGPGDDILVTIGRNGETMELHVTLSTAQEIQNAQNQPSTMPPSNGNYASACERLEKEFYNNPLLGVYVNSTGSATLTGTIPNTAAARVELQPGDVIEQLDGKDIPTFNDLKTQISTHRPGDHVIVTYRRDGVVRNAEAILNSYADVNQEMVSKLSEECNKRNGGFIAGERLNKVDVSPATLNLAPNPATGVVKIALTGLEAQDITVRVTDLIGNKFIDQHFSNNSQSFATTLDLSDVPKGVYVVSILQSGKSIKEKLIVE